jgi:hypothetical protein
MEKKFWEELITSSFHTTWTAQKIVHTSVGVGVFSVVCP